MPLDNRFGTRAVMYCGLVLAAASLGLVFAFDTLPVFLLAFALAGVLLLGAIALVRTLCEPRQGDPACGPVRAGNAFFAGIS